MQLQGWVLVWIVGAGFTVPDEAGSKVSAVESETTVQHFTLRGKGELAADTDLMALAKRLEAAYQGADNDGLEKAALAATRLAEDSETALRRHFEGLAYFYVIQMEQSSDKESAKKHVDLGIAALERALSLSPNFQESRSYLAAAFGNKIGLSEDPRAAGMELGPKAGRMAATALSKDPKNPVILTNRGVDLLFTPPMWGGGADKALGLLEEAVRLDPNYVEAHVWTGLCLIRKGEKENGIAKLREVRTRWPLYKRIVGLRAAFEAGFGQQDGH